MSWLPMTSFLLPCSRPAISRFLLPKQKSPKCQTVSFGPTVAFHRLTNSSSCSSILANGRWPFVSLNSMMPRCPKCVSAMKKTSLTRLPHIETLSVTARAPRDHRDESSYLQGLSLDDPTFRRVNLPGRVSPEHLFEAPTSPHLLPPPAATPATRFYDGHEIGRASCRA